MILFLRRAVSWLVGATVTVVIALHEASAAVQFVMNAWRESFFHRALAGITFPAATDPGFGVIVFAVMAVVVAALVGGLAGALNASRLANLLERLGARIRSRGLPPGRKNRRKKEGADRPARAKLRRGHPALDRSGFGNDGK